jgi:hypothetical protein
MRTEFSIAQDRGIIRVVYTGKPEASVTSDMLRQVGALAARTQSGLLLFDVRDADLSDAYIDAIRHAEEGESLGIRRSFRIAILGTADPVLGYIENVAVNRGYTAKTFTDADAAEAWLRS